jgi:toxin ParE1/3/4
MAVYSLSSKAAADLSGIYEYTILNFGLKQARDNLTGLHGRFESLAQNPMQGRTASEFSPGMRRLEYQSHVVFYVPKDKGVRFVRVLHHSMDMKRHI